MHITKSKIIYFHFDVSTKYFCNKKRKQKIIYQQYRIRETTGTELLVCSFLCGKYSNYHVVLISTTTLRGRVCLMAKSRKLNPPENNK